MGIGDQLLASGLAKGAAARGKRIAFGDRQRIIWDQHSAEIFRGNPNIAPPGSERSRNLEWIPFYKGHRLYNEQDKVSGRWIWNKDFRAIPGEIYLDQREIATGKRYRSGFIVIEPYVPTWKSASVNKDWGWSKYQQLATQLVKDGFRVGQFTSAFNSKARLSGADGLKTRDFRDALAIMKEAALYIGPEGGLHHGAAAIGKPAVVIFGGFIPPSVTGYETHRNFTGGAEACGSLSACEHCRRAMQAISVDEVYAAARDLL